MCNIVEANSDLKPFDHDKIEKIAENLRKIWAWVVLLTWWEPFLRSDIDDIVRIFKSKNLDVRTQTAWLLIKKDKITKCVDYGLRDINISIDSLDEWLSDYINSLKWSRRNAMKTISFVSNTFPAKDSICALWCVLSRYNIDEIDAILDFATKIWWRLSLVPVHITWKDSPLNFRWNDYYFKFQEGDLPKLKILIERLKKKKRQWLHLFDSDDYLDSIYDFIKTWRPSWRHKNVCDSPNLYFAILPDGSFAPCCDHRFWEKVYVYDPDFPKIYKSKLFRNNVTKITKKCPGCNFGSYPEMTLSARSFWTIKERIILQLKTKKSWLKSYSEDELFVIIDEIRKQYPDVYKNIKDMPYRDEKFYEV
jgi:MoaA/NifB/PqqE/SkfB family radical SAM enzyme